MARRLNPEEAAIFSDKIGKERMAAYLEEWLRWVTEDQDDSSDPALMLQPWFRGTLPDPSGS